jgi:hypothetical protein
MIHIAQPIVGYAVVTGTPAETSPEPPLQERPQVLDGCTYKVKTPLSDHALYITINNVDGPDGLRPFEIFINSKAMEHFQWIVALTRVISATFRQGGDCTFLVEELHSVFDPKGGYFKKGGRFMPSLVAEIGDVIRTHLESIGLLKQDTSLGDAARSMVASKRHALEKNVQVAEEVAEETGESGVPANATLCGKCGMKAVIVMDGCATCLVCGDSKCG